jgi:hypothetical protein
MLGSGNAWGSRIRILLGMMLRGRRGNAERDVWRMIDAYLKKRFGK